MKELIIKPRVNAIIADVPQIKFEEVSAAFSELSLYASVGFLVLDAKQMTKFLESELLLPLFATLNPNTTATIFPGNGAKSLKSYISSSTLEVINETFVIAPSIIRTPRNSNIQVDISTSLPKNIKNAICIDDVYFTGATCQAVTRKMAAIEPYFNDISWSLCTWLLSYTLETAWNEQWLDKKYVYRYRRTGSTTAAMNSLSTLVGNEQKSEDVRNNYASRFFPNSQTKFFDVLSELKKNL